MKQILSSSALLAVFLLVSCSRDPNVAFSERPLKTLVCFGDSITEGVGASSGEDFPSLLSRELGANVVNAGISGNTTQDALARIERDVVSRNPDLVIVEFGGNDFLRQVDSKTALDNLELIVRRLHEARIAVILLDVPYGIFGGNFSSGLKAIQKKYKTGFSRVLKEVLTKPNLKSDQIHPNAEGYRVIARALLTEIRTIYGSEVFKPTSSV